MTKPPAMILAGGQARRLSDKPLASLAGQPLVAHVIARLQSQVDGLAINAQERARFEPFGLPVISDDAAAGLGPLSGVLTAMRWAEDLGAETVLTVPVDCPFLPLDLAERLSGGTGLRLAATWHEGKLWAQPTVGLWPVRLRADLEDALAEGIRKVTEFTGTQGAQLVAFEDTQAFFNVNTPEDLATANAQFPPAR